MFFSRYMSYRQPVLSPTHTPATTPLVSQSSIVSSFHCASSGQNNYTESPVKQVRKISEDIIEEMKGERPQPVGSCDNTPDGEINVSNQIGSENETTNVQNNSDEHGIKTKDTEKNAMVEFEEKIMKYYNDYVSIKQSQVEEIMQVVRNVYSIFIEAMGNSLPKYKLMEKDINECIFPQLYTTEMSSVSILLNFIPLEESMWALQDGGESVYSAFGYCLVKRTNQSFFTHGSSVFDGQLVSDYLSGTKVRRLLLEMCHRGINWGFSYKVLPAVTGDAVVLRIYQDDIFVVALQLIPCLHLGNFQAIAVSHPGAMEDAGLENLWLKYDNIYPISKLPDTSDLENKTLLCMRILYSICKNHTETFIFSEECIIATVLRCAEEDIPLHDLFINSWKALTDAVDVEFLSSFSYNKRNLLQYYQSNMMEFTSKFMKAVIAQNLHEKLLDARA